MKKQQDPLLKRHATIRGRVVQHAHYFPQTLEPYKNNPWIEAYFQIIPEDEFVKMIGYYPRYDDSSRELQVEERLHLIPDMEEFFEPLNIHLDLWRRISVGLARSYRGRNPLNIHFWSNLEADLKQLSDFLEPIFSEEITEKDDAYDKYAKALDSTFNTLDEERQLFGDKSKNSGFNLESEAEEQNRAEMLDPGYNTTDVAFKASIHGNRSANRAFMLMGVSGNGKTISMKAMLSLIPQVICHQEYRGQEFIRRQLVWLYLECPEDASVKQLCRAFFLEVDAILDTTYAEDYKKYTKEQLVLSMARVASIHGLGILVIDEIQNAVPYRAAKARLMNTYVGLTNIVGIMVIPVGTLKAQKMILRTLRAARRAIGPVWKSLDDENFDHFLTSLWRYQFTRKKVPLTAKLRDAFYEETQGIIDLMVKLYGLVQSYAIITGKEEFDAPTVHFVARQSFESIRDMIDAIKANDIQSLLKYEDLVPVDIGGGIQKMLGLRQNALLNSYQESRQIAKQNQLQPKGVPALSSGTGEDIKSEGGAKKGTQKRKTSKQKKQRIQPDGYLALFQKAQDLGVSVYEVLKEAGHIKHVSEFWDNQTVIA